MPRIYCGSTVADKAVKGAMEAQCIRVSGINNLLLALWIPCITTLICQLAGAVNRWASRQPAPQ
jgi:hypothetical protein